MEFNRYKEIMKERFSRFFNISDRYTYGEYEFDLFAEFNIRNEKYMATRKLTIYAFENDEYCFLKHYEGVTKDDINKYIDMLKRSMHDFVTPHTEHMSTTITGILVVDRLLDKSLIREIEKFRYQKSFLLGIKGWVEVRIILVDLSDETIYMSKKARDVAKFYKP